MNEHVNNWVCDGTVGRNTDKIAPIGTSLIPQLLVFSCRGEEVWITNLAFILIIWRTC